MGGYPPHGTGPGGFPVPGGAVIDGTAPAVVGILEVVVHPDRDGEVKGGV